MINLKPCPNVKCKSSNLMRTLFDDRHGIMCSDCGLEYAGFSTTYESEKEWNTRPNCENCKNFNTEKCIVLGEDENDNLVMLCQSVPIKDFHCAKFSRRED